MRNQFIYTITQTSVPSVGTQTNEKVITTTKTASFNIDKVIRSMEIEDGSLVVILDDFHEENKQTMGHNQNGKPIVKTEQVVLQSEIILSPKDKERFLKLTSIEQ